MRGYNLFIKKLCFDNRTLWTILIKQNDDPEGRLEGEMRAEARFETATLERAAVGGVAAVEKIGQHGASVGTDMGAPTVDEVTEASAIRTVVDFARKKVEDHHERTPKSSGLRREDPERPGA